MYSKQIDQRLEELVGVQQFYDVKDVIKDYVALQPADVEMTLLFCITEFTGDLTLKNLILDVYDEDKVLCPYVKLHFLLSRFFQIILDNFLLGKFFSFIKKSKKRANVFLTGLYEL